MTDLVPQDRFHIYILMKILLFCNIQTTEDIEKILEKKKFIKYNFCGLTDLKHTIFLEKSFLEEKIYS